MNSAIGEPGLSATLAQLSEEMRRGEVSPVDATKACLSRIERLQPTLNAFITVTSAHALKQAEQAEGEILTGRWLGPLHGAPVAVKDFFDTAGIRTTAAFEHFSARVPEVDAQCVARLAAAGAILVGKTNMHTLGMGTSGLESHFGPVRNPSYPDLAPGGSSSGSAAAVASGQCYATVDTDAIGSCRLPAACCGVVGFKGSYGLIDLTGILAGEPPPDEQIVLMSHGAVTARTVEDVSLVLAAIAEEPVPSRLDLTPHKDLVVGVAQNCPPGDAMAALFEGAQQMLRELGYALRSATAPEFGFGRSFASIAQDRALVSKHFFSDIDVLLLPTMPDAPPRISDATHPLAVPATYTAFANYYGLPAISIPFGESSGGLPFGVQIVGRPGDDATVLTVAHRLQSARREESLSHA